MDAFDLDAWLARSRALDLDDLDWDAAACHPLPPEARRALVYMQDVESHTIVYLRQLLATRAIDDPAIAAFLASWIYEETAHGRALDRFLAAAGHPLPPRAAPRSADGLVATLERVTTAALSRAWPDFVAVHMAWGQADAWLRRPGAARVARFLVDRLWAPVGSGVRSAEETRFLARYLLSGEDGRAAARRVDETIRRLPGFDGARLLEAWSLAHA
ncbi:MAG TPA: hypothetical protein VMW35_00090 [Myxococcota bacterium]|jgi:hypothetical protein|nr:hypothetical protein [Myxococcota bacterium]